MKKITVSEAKEIINTNDSVKINELIEELKNDERISIKNLFTSHYKKIEKYEQKKKKFEMKKNFDRSYCNEKFILGGIDEVGRGPFAGPVVAASVILKKDFYHLDIDDSKKITEEKRDELYDYIKNNAISIGIGIASPNEIDELNILEATKLAMKRAIESMKQKPDIYLIDAVSLKMNIKQEAIIKGDEKSVVIGAASIIAKVTRDKMMKKIHEMYPMYDFINNKGYGTKNHIEAIREYGIVKNIHRNTFVKNIL